MSRFAWIRAVQTPIRGLVPPGSVGENQSRPEPLFYSEESRLSGAQAVVQAIFRGKSRGMRKYYAVNYLESRQVLVHVD